MALRVICNLCIVEQLQYLMPFCSELRQLRHRMHYPILKLPPVHSTIKLKAGLITMIYIYIIADQSVWEPLHVRKPPQA